MHQFQEYKQTGSELSKRGDRIKKESLNLENRDSVLKQILGFVDLTTLSGDDTNQRVLELCHTGMSFFDGEKGIPNVAAICVFPVFANVVHHALKGTDIKTACVAGAFPSGQSPLPLRIDEVKYAVDHGADEIDMVISRGRLIEGDEAFIDDEVRMIKAACGEAHLKVILETGELKSVDLIRKASELAINAGADFIKTSTGKVDPAATPEAFLIMLDTIKEYFEATGKMIGIKPAGGISEPDEAIYYFAMVKSVLGEAWLNATHFRIGASRLAGKVYKEILASG
jgi:deoxyribose-phosphate aldolase